MKRFTVDGCDYDIYSSDQGDYVLYEDVEDFLKEHLVLQDRLKSANTNIAMLKRALENRR